jgi:pyruvate,orthophosphate dikinase
VRVLVERELDPGASQVYDTFRKLMLWSDKFRQLRVRANADQPDQSATAIAFGAEGIGLCRTEHMFFGGERIDAVREMILAGDEAGRRSALAKLLPMQRQDFVEIFRVMKDRPVTIRTLDPPLHEFLPHTDREVEVLAGKIGVSRERVNLRMDQLKEFNPMLGNRGCRLGIVFPEITEMQARAIFEAACLVKKEGVDVHPEVMIPLVGFVNELKEEEQIVRRVAEEVFAQTKVRVNYLVGTMIELPRAAVTADEIASVAEFFSFGTNDLTQTTLGLSRDDSATFLPQYIDHGIFDQDPFQTIDQKGVGVLMEIAVGKGRAVRKHLKIGICGEHGGEPKSVAFCSGLGMDYVSCSPYRLPIARLAAAQAAIAGRLHSAQNTRTKAKPRTR